ncbi:hypothetical protein H257_03677 [Aphanomyces astaci]|uniref:Uncharacterized protein n=1 Tax=Aphanomyces astaci TaxID=112090 RepID=W4GXM3_APHAT|nr:hypothetical protein H257_03677 [Aphanomyces astaci]ETV84480.1 hypothetical protein H257_03677 [Aphanomyces astaci]|eukprot:XP_009826172.1 hypothetical protein H257_03677 [Aphanomyces astaci]
MEAATLVVTPLVKNVDKIPGIHPNVDEGQTDDDWEMPLLFMTHMPVNFIQNIDVAAMSTFSAEYNDDGSQDECEPRTSPPKAGKIQEKGNHRAQSRKQSNPYAKPRVRGSVSDLQTSFSAL